MASLKGTMAPLLKMLHHAHDCPEGYYTVQENMCAHCDTICNPRYGTMSDCMEKCSEYYNNTMHTTTSSVLSAPSSSTPLPLGIRGALGIHVSIWQHILPSFGIGIIVGVCLVLSILLMILLMRRMRKSNHASRRPDVEQGDEAAKFQDAAVDTGDTSSTAPLIGNDSPDQQSEKPEKPDTGQTADIPVISDDSGNSSMTSSDCQNSVENQRSFNSGTENQIGRPETERNSNTSSISSKDSVQCEDKSSSQEKISVAVSESTSEISQCSSDSERALLLKDVTPTSSHHTNRDYQTGYGYQRLDNDGDEILPQRPQERDDSRSYDHQPSSMRQETVPKRRSSQHSATNIDAAFVNPTLGSLQCDTAGSIISTGMIPATCARRESDGTGDYSGMMFDLRSANTDYQSGFGGRTGIVINGDNPSTSVTSSNHNKWDGIMCLYGKVEAQLYKFPWIVGCMISNDVLEVVTNMEKVQSSETEAHNALYREIPDGLRQYLKFTPDGVSMEQVCSTFGSGGTICEVVTGDKLARRAMVSLVGSSDGDSYAFSVGHVVDDEGTCTVSHNKYSKNHEPPVEARCVSRVNNLSNYKVSNITHKVYDIALFKLCRPVPQANNNDGFEGRKDKMSLIIDQTKVDPRKIYNQDVLIFGNPDAPTRKGRISCVACSRGNGFEVNLIGIKSSNLERPLEILPGLSGSLVTSVPDENHNVKAFAYVVGRKPEDTKTAYAVPLWEAMLKVCPPAQLKSMNFDDFIPDESGFESMVSEPTGP